MQTHAFRIIIACWLCTLPGCSKPIASTPSTDSTVSTIQTPATAATVDAVAKSTDELKDKIDFSGHFKPELLTDEFSKQPIEVSGEVRAIDPKGAYDFPRLSLASSDEAEILEFFIQGQSEDFTARFAPGQKVKIRGTVGEFKESEFATPIKDVLWTVVEAGPNPAPIIQSVDLVKKFQSDSAAASAKYGFKILYVIGEIVEMDANDPANLVLKGEGAGAVRIQTKMLTDVSKLKIGEQAQFQGRFESAGDDGIHPSLTQCLPVFTPLPAPGISYAE